MIRLRKRRETTIPTDSFSDIAFLLIIFFIIATTLTRTMGVMSEIPSGQKSDQQVKDKTPTIALTGEDIRFEDRLVSLDLLNERLREMNLIGKHDNDRIIIIESNKDVSWHIYFEVMRMVSASGGVVALARETDTK